MSAVPRTGDVREEICAVPDPELPVLSIADLGIVREVAVDEPSRRVRVVVTPTFSGCPAMEVIESDIRAAATRLGYQLDLVTRLSPPWTSDWVSDEGREALRRFGIAPASAGGPRVGGPVGVHLAARSVACPHCGSADTEEVSPFGSTACKAQRRCRSCAEPFDEFKAV